jgi:DHA2 family multidrug resistance protein-like MFS transporter
MRAGLWTLPWAIGFVIGSLATPALARRIPPAPLMAWGLVLSSIGYFLLTTIGQSTAHLPLFAVATTILSFGASPLFTLTNDIIIGSAPPERAGAASGISETCAEFGGALGIAIFGSIGVAIYRMAMNGALPPGLPAEATSAAISTLGGAVAVSRQVPAQIGASLVAAARGAFLQGLVLCAAISGVGSLALAAFAAGTFRRVPALQQQTGEHQVEAVA